MVIAADGAVTLPCRGSVHFHHESPDFSQQLLSLSILKRMCLPVTFANVLGENRAGFLSERSRQEATVHRGEPSCKLKKHFIFACPGGTGRLLGRLRQEDGEFRACLGYRMRLS